MNRASNHTLPLRARIVFLALFAAAAAVFSCGRVPVPEEGSGAAGQALRAVPGKDAPACPELTDSLVRFVATELPFGGLSVETKTAPVTSLSSFYASVTTPGGRFDQQVYTNRVFTLVDGDFVSDLFWPVDGGITWQFDCANTPLTWTADGFEVSVTNAFDLLVARLPYAERKVKNEVVFEHAFARIDDVVISAAAGCTLSGVSLLLTPVVSGTFNLKRGVGHHDGTGWSWSDPEDLGAEQNIAPATAGTTHPDLLLVPGTYLLRAAWTATDGVDTVSFTDMVQTVEITGGRNNVISMTLGMSL